MLQANELRIGNLIMFMGREIVVHGGTIQDIERGNENSRLYEPIPLTPEVLEAAGFRKEKMDRYTVYFYNGLRLIPSNDYKDGRFHIVGLHLVDFELIYVFTVHQLQNLCFALTGEELEVNLTSQKCGA